MRKLQGSLLLDNAIKKYLLHCKAVNLAPRTIETYKLHLTHFYNFTGNVPCKTINENVIEAYILSRNTLSHATINNHLRSIKAFCNYLKLGLTFDPIKEKKSVILPLQENQVKALLKQPDKSTFSGVRDYAILSILLDTGVRVEELTTVRRVDIFDNHIKVTGKGNKERIVPLGNSSLLALQKYLLAVSDIPDDKPLFVSVYDNQLSRNQIYKRIREYGKTARITGVRVSPHTLRHSFARMFLLNGGDIFCLQEMLGHETLDMVRRYVKIFKSDLDEQHRKFSPLDGLVKRKRKL